MKISFVTTVLNEEKTIERLLVSLLFQSKKPNEIIIIDGGGSKDKTVERIKEFKKNHPTTIIYIIVVKGANRARGRNVGIKKATGEIVAVSDAGCKLERDWLKKIVEPFSSRRNHAFANVQSTTVRGDFKSRASADRSQTPKVSSGQSVDVVAGFYQPVTKSVFEECLACYTCVMPDKLDSVNFLPSSRSIAFRKSAWKEVGGYPENLDYCEDLIFVKKLKEKGAKFVFIQDALVFWRQKENILEAFIQFFNYASGDAKALYWPHLKKIALVYLRYLLGVSLLIIVFVYHILIYDILTIGFVFVYFLWAIRKNYHYVQHRLALFYLPLLQITADLAVMSGAIRGLLNGIIKPDVWDFYRKR